jgi:hypothetical protein
LEPFPHGYKPIEWDGDPTCELISGDGTTLGDFDGEQVAIVPDSHPNPLPESSLLMVADLYGDFRDELVVTRTLGDGSKVVTVITSSEPINKRHVAASEDLTYRLWVGRNMGGGYASDYHKPLE